MSDNRLLLIDSDDERSPEEVRAALEKEAPHARLKLIEEISVAEEGFANLDELLDKEEEDAEGREFEWSAIPGFFVYIAGSVVVGDVLNKLTNEYRKNNRKIGAKGDIPTQASFRLMATALVEGHAVKGWRGATFRERGEVPFSKEEFVSLYRQSKRFRDFAFGHFERLAGIAEKARAADRGE